MHEDLSTPQALTLLATKLLLLQNAEGDDSTLAFASPPLGLVQCKYTHD
mgnify:CR=1 FL=1